MRIYLIFISLSIIFFTNCTIFNPVTIRTIPVPEWTYPVKNTSETYRVKVYNPLCGREDLYYVPAGHSCEIPFDKTGLSFVEIVPGSLPDPFSPLPLGGILDPQSENPLILSAAGGVSVSIYQQLHRSGYSMEFNFLRLEEEIRTRLGNGAWQLDQYAILQDIRSGDFTARSIKLSGGEIYQVFFSEGLWSSEDPGRPSIHAEGKVRADVTLYPGKGIRYIECNSGVIKEIYCTDQGRILVMDL